MSSLFQLSDRLQRAFEPTPLGVVGVVDELLILCPKQGLQFEWRGNQCHVRSLGSQPHEPIELPPRKSVFRAMLARMAALCNESTPNSVSPYGGSGEVSARTEPPTCLGVAFVNTPDEQRLELRVLAKGNGAKVKSIAQVDRHQ